MAMVITFACFALMFDKILPSEGAEKVSMDQISVDIVKNGKTFFDKIDEEHLQSYIEKLMNNVANSAIGEPQVAIDQRVDLEFLIEDSSAAFMVLKAMIAELHEAVVEVTDEILEEANIKRSQLKLSTFLSTYEYPAHDFGFKRFVNKPKL